MIKAVPIRPAHRAALTSLAVATLVSLLALACKPGAPTGLGNPPVSVDIDVAAVSLSTAGENTTLVAVALDGEGFPIAGVTVSWRSSDEAVATVDGEGVVTAVASGIAFVTATVDGVSSGPVTVTVRLPIVAIDVQPQGISFNAVGEMQTITATARDAAGAEVPGVVFTWLSSDPSIATVSSDGEVTAVSTGSAGVTASAAGETSAPVAIGVMLSVASIDVVPTSASLAFLGETTTLTATARDASGTVLTGVTFTWASSDQSVASVSNSGVVTAVANGGASVAASVGTVSSSAVSITVQQVAATINVSPTSLDFASLGDTASLSAVARDAGGAVIPGASYNWNSSSSGVASVSNAGLVSAVSNGTTTVTASLDGATSNGVTVNVQQVVVSISVTPTSLSISVIGQSAQLTAVALDAGGSPVPGASLSWTSSNPAVATVSQTGLVTAAGLGLSQVTANAGGGVVSNAVNVRVLPSRIVFDAASTAVATNTSGAAWLHTIGGGSNRMLVVGVTVEAPTSSVVDVASVTYNGVALAKQIDDSTTTGFTSNVEIWILDEVRLPAAGTYTVVVSFQGTVAETASGAISLENVDQSSSEATGSNTSQSQQSISTSVTTQTPSAWVVDVVHAGTPGTFTPGVGQTERFDVGLSGARGAASTIEVTVPGSVSVTQTLSTTANRLVHAAVVLAPQ